jgi:hypothetical protein
MNWYPNIKKSFPILTVFGCAVGFTFGCSEGGGDAGNTEAGLFTDNPVLKVSVVDEFKLLSTGVNPSPDFVESDRGKNGKVKPEKKEPAAFDCQKLTMGDFGTALLWDPKGFAKGQSHALSAVSNAGYFATADRAAKKILELSKNGGFRAILCQWGNSYELDLSTTKYQIQGNKIVFETTRKEGLGYQSYIRVVVDLKWDKVEEKVGTKGRALTFYSIEKLGLDTKAGNAETWFFAQSSGNSAVLKQNLRKYLAANAGDGDIATAADLDANPAPAALCTTDTALNLEVLLKANVAKAFGRADITSESSFVFELRRHGVSVEKKVKETTSGVGAGIQYFREYFDITQDGKYEVVATPRIPGTDTDPVGDFPNPSSSANTALVGSTAATKASLKSSSFEFVVKNKGTGAGCTLEFNDFSSVEKNGVIVSLSAKKR